MDNTWTKHNAFIEWLGYSYAGETENMDHVIGARMAPVLCPWLIHDNSFILEKATKGYSSLLMINDKQNLRIIKFQIIIRNTLLTYARMTV